MNKIRIIDLLNKIANGEESDIITEFEFDKRVWNFKALNDSEFCLDGWLLNQDITITKTKHKEVLEEEKKIPEKINNSYTKQSIEDMKEARFNSNDMEKICNRIGWLMENRNELSNKIDEIIDYLKSKGE